MHVNTTATELLLQHATKHGSRLLFASTSEIYGDPHEHPQRESYWGNVNPIGPRSVYDEAKRFGETLMSHFHRSEGTDTVIVRIFNTYGPRMHPNDGRVVSNFIVQALQGKDITIYGDGQQTRSFCYVSDLIEGIYQLLLSDESRPVNIGNSNEVSLLDFAKEIIALSGTNSKITLKPLPQDDPKQRQPDISRAKQALGWEPMVTRKEGLILTCDYFKKHLADSSKWVHLLLIIESVFCL